MWLVNVLQVIEEEIVLGKFGDEHLKIMEEGDARSILA